jgi:hypothetical protein
MQKKKSVKKEQAKPAQAVQYLDRQGKPVEEITSEPPEGWLQLCMENLFAFVRLLETKDGCDYETYLLASLLRKFRTDIDELCRAMKNLPGEIVVDFQYPKVRLHDGYVLLGVRLVAAG